MYSAASAIASVTVVSGEVQMLYTAGATLITTVGARYRTILCEELFVYPYWH